MLLSLAYAYAGAPTSHTLANEPNDAAYSSHDATDYPDGVATAIAAYDS